MIQFDLPIFFKWVGEKPPSTPIPFRDQLIRLYLCLNGTAAVLRLFGTSLWMSVCCIYVPHIVESLVESTASVDHFQPRHPEGMHCQTVVAEWAISKTGEDRKSTHTHTHMYGIWGKHSDVMWRRPSKRSFYTMKVPLLQSFEISEKNKMQWNYPKTPWTYSKLNCDIAKIKSLAAEKSNAQLCVFFASLKFVCFL